MKQNKPIRRFKMIGSSYLMLFKGDNILMSRRFNTGYEDGKYSLPAGHVEAGETLTAALAREVGEEIGLVLNLKYTELVHVMHRRHNDIRVDYFFTCQKYSGIPTNLEPDKCDDIRFFPVKNLPDNTIPYIRHAIACVRRGEIYSEFGWDKAVPDNSGA